MPVSKQNNRRRKIRLFDFLTLIKALLTSSPEELDWFTKEHPVQRSEAPKNVKRNFGKILLILAVFVLFNAQRTNLLTYHSELGAALIAAFFTDLIFITAMGSSYLAIRFFGGKKFSNPE